VRGRVCIIPSLLGEGEKLKFEIQFIFLNGNKKDEGCKSSRWGFYKGFTASGDEMKYSRGGSL